MSRELLQRVLKVLKVKRLRLDEHLIPIIVEEIEQELAKPEQELPTLHQVVIESALKGYGKPEQEPVNNDYVDIHCPSCLHSFAIAPLRKEWVGLTNDEINKIANSPQPFDETSSGYVLPFAKAIQSKLKEKNT
jgi:hypothetical protein